MTYPIAISGNDTGTLTQSAKNLLARLGAESTPVRLGIGGGIGALVGHLAGKHALIGAVIGAVGGYAITTVNADGSPLK